MAVTDLKAFAHLTEADVEAIGRELDELRRDVEESRGASDAAYIKRAIALQRGLVVGGRVTLFASAFPPAWVAGTTMLGLAKIIENMELGHNVIHGQWDWMNDPEVHSSAWEWDTACPSEQWKHSHNFVHHKYTNVVGKDDDVGYGILRVTRDQKWHPVYLAQPLTNAVLALLFQYAVALHDLNIAEIRKGRKDMRTTVRQLKQIGRKVGRQIGKDYVLFPLLTGPQFLSTLTANATANLMRNLWSYTVIFCGHFPDGAEKFTVQEFEDETPHEWYLRQMLGSANFKAGPLMAFMSGNLCYQIEHHLFPDLPSNRYAEMSVRIKALCEKYDLPYTTGSLAQQYSQTLRTIWKLALPNRFLKATADAAPETASERGGTVQQLRGTTRTPRLRSA
ncbi:MAG: putative fatty acid desaturase [Frankiales bacterium]|nr:putative fatty acid desaturase [Frankiales bacterium]